MNYPQSTIWLIILGLGIGTFLFRFSFFGIIGNRPLPAWFERHLRYVGIAVMPAIVTPLVVWPTATGGELDAPRLIAALAAFGVGIWQRSVIWSVLVGFATLYSALYLLG